MISLPILLVSLGCAMAIELTPVHEWTYIDYHWNSESEKELAIAEGLYNYTNIILYDAESHKGKMFVTTPRTHQANPASLSTIFEESGDKKAALLQPYPSPEWHIVGDCSGITNALKFVIDKCDNMWIADSGVIGNEVICPAQILKFDLKTDRLVMRHMISEEVSKSGLLATNAVRTEGAKCEKIMLFAADLRGSGYVIFDGITSWRLDNDIFEPDENLSNFPVDDRTINIAYGPIGFLSLDEKFANTELGLMSSFSASHAYGLPMQDLVKSRDSQENLQWFKSVFEFPSALTATVISKDGIIFTGFIGANKLDCAWLGNSLISENIETLIEDSKLPLEITSLKTSTDNDGNEYLWLAMNDYLRMRAGIMNFHKVNSGIYVVKIADLTNGTRCQPRAHFQPAKSWTEKGFVLLENHDDFNN